MIDVRGLTFTYVGGAAPAICKQKFSIQDGEGSK
jgi:hypothetical protein